MKILILTQDENVYLPKSIFKVSKSLHRNIRCIVTAPSMSTHGGFLKGLIKNINLFGFLGTLIIIFRIFYNKFFSFLFLIGMTKKPYSIKNVSSILNIPYYSISKVDSSHFQELINKYKPDLLISISCPQIVKRKVRDRFNLGCINVHGSPLPKYRGLLPSFWVLKNKEKETAVTVHELRAKLDDGEILGQRIIPINVNDTWDSLVKKLKVEGAQLLIETVKKIRLGEIKKRPNNEDEATYYSYPSKLDRIDFIEKGNKFFDSLF